MFLQETERMPLLNHAVLPIGYTNMIKKSTDVYFLHWQMLKKTLTCLLINLDEKNIIMASIIYD